jgi:hypothetical protein
MLPDVGAHRRLCRDTARAARTGARVVAIQRTCRGVEEIIAVMRTAGAGFDGAAGEAVATVWWCEFPAIFPSGCRQV